MKHFLISSGICLFALVSQAGAQVFFMDTYNTDDDSVEVHFTPFVLEDGVDYRLRVDGTFSVWVPAFWTDPCGAPESAPMYPSDAGSITGTVGFDFEYIFAYPHQALPCNELPVSTDRFEISLDNGQSWQYLIGSDTAYNMAHLYTYTVTGTGQPFGIRHNSAGNADDYGQLRLEFERLPGELGMQIDAASFYAAIPAGGVIFKDVNGNCWKLRVDAAGDLKTNPVSCPD